MAHFFRNLVIVLVVSSGLLLPAYAQDQSNLEQERALLESLWQGKWLSSSGFVYSANTRLHVASDLSIEGEITWTLEKSPRAEEQAKIGLTAIEYVRGNYNSQSRILRLEGYRKDDPNNVIGLDKYHLVISDNSEVIGGITWNHGDWQGLISLKRESNR